MLLPALCSLSLIEFQLHHHSIHLCRSRIWVDVSRTTVLKAFRFEGRVRVVVLSCRFRCWYEEVFVWVVVGQLRSLCRLVSGVRSFRFVL
jgi:hypothetical protein